MDSSESTGQEAGKPSAYQRSERQGRNYQRPAGAPRPGKLEGTSLAIPVIGNLGKTEVPGVPRPNLYTAGSGRVFSTEVVRDRIMTAKPTLFSPQWSPQWNEGAGVYFQQAGTNQDAGVNSVIGGISKEMYSIIVRALMIDGNIAMRDTTLANAGTGADSLSNWLMNYMQAFGLIRAAQGALSIGNFNYTTSLIADAANRNIFAIQAALRRLRTYAVPPMLVEFLDRMCGPKIGTEDDPIIFPMPAIASPTTIGNSDLTTAAAWASALTLAETQLTNLAIGTATCPAADAQAICNTFGQAYGTPDIPLDKAPEQDPCVYLMWRTQVYTFSDTSATAKTFSWPNASAGLNVPGSFPLLIPRDYKGSALRQAMSMFRGNAYSIDPVGGLSNVSSLANQVGWVGNQQSSATGSVAIYYNQNGAGIVVAGTNSGPKTYGYNSSELEMELWSGEAGLEAADYNSESRAFQDMDRVYITTQQILNETSYLQEVMFLEPLRGNKATSYR